MEIYIFVTAIKWTEEFRDYIIDKIHREIKEIHEYVNSEFKTNNKFVRNMLAFLYLRAAINYRDLITKGIFKDNISDLRELLDNYTFSLIDPLDTNSNLEEIRDYLDNFRYKNEGESIEKLLKIIDKNSSNIRDILGEQKPIYIL